MCIRDRLNYMENYPYEQLLVLLKGDVECRPSTLGRHSSKPARLEAAELVVQALASARRMVASQRGGLAIDPQQFHRCLAGGGACGLASRVCQDRNRNVTLRQHDHAGKERIRAARVPVRRRPIELAQEPPHRILAGPGMQALYGRGLEQPVTTGEPCKMELLSLIHI